LSALCAAFAAPYARLYLRALRRDGETRQCAESLFLAHDLSCTKARTSVLLLVARFERKVEIVADTGFRGRIAPAEWATVVDATTTALANGAGGGAILAGVDRLEALLLERGYRGAGTPGVTLPDAPIEAADA